MQNLIKIVKSVQNRMILMYFEGFCSFFEGSIFYLVRKLTRFESMIWFYKYPKGQKISFFHFTHTKEFCLGVNWSRLFSIIMTTEEYFHLGFDSFMYMYFVDFELQGIYVYMQFIIYI